MTNKEYGFEICNDCKNCAAVQKKCKLGMVVSVFEDANGFISVIKPPNCKSYEPKDW